MKRNTLKAIVLVCAWLACATGAGAQQPEAKAAHSYAVLSLIGDKLTVVQFATRTGTLISGNPKTVVPINSPVLDDMALLAAEAAIKELEPSSTLDLLSVDDKNLYRLQGDLLVQSGESSQGRDKLKLIMKNNVATQLILITKHHGDARFELVSGTVGSGKLDGLGFYVDNTMALEVVETQSIDSGFLSPFAYVTVSLLDADLNVIRTKSAKATQIVPNAVKADAALNAWQVLTQEHKIDYLKAMIRRSLRQALPEVIGSSKVLK